MFKLLFDNNEVIIDIFDELEGIIYIYPDLINITTKNITNEINKRKENNRNKNEIYENNESSSNNDINNNKDDNRNNQNNRINRTINNYDNNNNQNTTTPTTTTTTTNNQNIVNEGSRLSSIHDNNINRVEINSFVSIYDLLNESFKAPFLPNYVDLLEQLKKCPLNRSGMNKKTQQIEEYFWKNPHDLLTYEQGGRLGELNQERGGGKLTNWHTAFYGYSNDDPIIESDNNRKESKRVACLLCEKFETLQLVKNTLVRHIKNHHKEIYSIYCPDDFSHSNPIILDISSDLTKLQSSIAYWEIIMKLIRYFYSYSIYISISISNFIEIHLTYFYFHL